MKIRAATLVVAATVSVVGLGAAPAGVAVTVAGAKWVPVTQLGISGESVRPQAIAATAGGDVWVAGYVYTGLEFRTFAERRHAGTWTRVDTPDVETAPAYDFLDGVVAVSPTDVWMVGSSAVSSTDLASTPLIEHWDGTSVSIVPAPVPATLSDASLQAVSGTANDLWAVGTARNSSFNNVALVMHYDGSAWSVAPFAVTAPNCPSGLGSDLLAVLNRGGGDVYVGGWCHTPQHQIGFIEHLDHGTWVPAATVPPIGQINSLTAAPDGSVWAAGSEQSHGGGAGWLRGMALHGSGSAFVPVDQPVPKAGVDEGFASIVVAGGAVLAVGSATSPQPPFAGFGAYSLTGTTWSSELVRTPFGGFGAFDAATVDSTGHVLATGFGIAASGDDVAIVSTRRG